MAVSLVLELNYGVSGIGSAVGYVSIIECALAVLMFAGYFVFKIMSGDFFGEFTYEFKT